MQESCRTILAEERHSAIPPVKLDSPIVRKYNILMKVFISYAENDLEFAQRLYKDLKSAGLKPWLDEKDILAGQDRKFEIRRAIKDSSYFLALLSSNSFSERGYVRKEQKIALEILDEIPEDNIFIIPVRIDNCEIPDENLQKLQCVDLSPSYEDGLEKIIHALKISANVPEKTVTEQDAKFSDKAKTTDSDSGQKKPKLNIFHSKMCNRDRQLNDFWYFFQAKSKECPNQPQFFFIHGDELEGHGSFIFRLKKTHLKKYAENKWGEKHADVPLKKVSWPGDGDFETRKRDLKMNLTAGFDEYHDDYSVAALSQLARWKKNSLVIIKHNIYTSQWNKQDEQLINWYIKEYWSALECSDNTPQFLIFFNIQYAKPNRSGWIKRLFKKKIYAKKHITEQLGCIYESVKEVCQCVLIEELKPVAIKDVMDWFSFYNVYENELHRKKKIESIFQENKKPVGCKCMAEIELALEKIIKEHEKEIFG